MGPHLELFSQGTYLGLLYRSNYLAMDLSYSSIVRYQGQYVSHVYIV